MFVISTICTNCTMYYSSGQYSSTYHTDSYTQWRNEQETDNIRLYNYSQSKAFKKQYEGISESNKVNAPNAKSIIGTEYDSLKDIRKPTSPLLPTNDVRVRIW